MLVLVKRVFKSLIAKLLLAYTNSLSRKVDHLKVHRQLEIYKPTVSYKNMNMMKRQTVESLLKNFNRTTGSVLLTKIAKIKLFNLIECTQIQRTFGKRPRQICCIKKRLAKKSISILHRPMKF